MRRLALTFALTAAWLLSACSSDLLHDTSWPTLCELDPPACGEPAQDAGADDGSAEDGADSSGDAAPDTLSDGPGGEAADGNGGG